MQVWVVTTGLVWEKGEDNIVGVYADEKLANAAFVTEYAGLDDRVQIAGVDIERLRQVDGSAYAEFRHDNWVRVARHQVVTG